RVDPAVEAETPDRQLVIFRVVQEALTNVRKHSGDTKPTVAIGYDDGTITIVVEDKGKGFDVASADRRGFGLAGMREPVRLAAGTCRVDSQPGRGTRVTVRLPASPSVQRDALLPGMISDPSPKHYASRQSPPVEEVACPSCVGLFGGGGSGDPSRR
ncbi:MAG: sensor histidine kinase, partial [Planctomycetota bacterium]